MSCETVTFWLGIFMGFTAGRAWGPLYKAMKELFGGIGG